MNKGLSNYYYEKIYLFFNMNFLK